MSASETSPQTQLLSVLEAGFELAAVQRLFQEYQASLGIDLCFQDFGTEFDNLSGKYHPSKAGMLFLVRFNGSPVGCGAYYQFAPGVCELKRVFVQPAAQGHGLGRQLVEALLDHAKAAGYTTVLLDSLGRLTAACALYERLGFQVIPPYNVNPHADVYYMGMDLANWRQLMTETQPFAHAAPTGLSG